MAGIGFVLRKLSQEDSLSGPLEAFARASFISAGPWIITVIILGTINYLSRFYSQFDTFNTFQSIILYNFCFSLVFSSPFAMGVTRHLADLIYMKDGSTVPGIMIGSCVLMLAILLPVAIWFYGFFAFMEAPLRLFAIANFVLITLMWHLSVFLTALVNFQTVTLAYLAGMILAGALTIVSFSFESSIWMLGGFNIGIALTVSILIAEILVEYPGGFKEPFSFLPSFKKYWAVCASGILYNTGAWVDKWIMWSSPEHEVLPNRLVLFSLYDSAAFAAYVITIPAMAFFLVYVETDFFEHYVNFYESIRKNASFKQILKNQESIQISLVRQARNLILIQGIIVFVVLGLSTSIFSLLAMNYLELGIFRMCVIGASYQIFLLFMSVILWYFDSRISAVSLQGFFLLSNLILSYASLSLGFTFYGSGFAVASILSYIFAAYLVKREVMNLPYFTFIRNNASVK